MDVDWSSADSLDSDLSHPAQAQAQAQPSSTYNQLEGRFKQLQGKNAALAIWLLSGC